MFSYTEQVSATEYNCYHGAFVYCIAHTRHILFFLCCFINSIKIFLHPIKFGGTKYREIGNDLVSPAAATGPFSCQLSLKQASQVSNVIAAV